ncbi:MAG: hypothetical protein WDO24_20825 [Pseudomonadota bacterium]
MRRRLVGADILDRAHAAGFLDAILDAAVVLSHISGSARSGPLNVVLPLELVLRKSCAPPRSA